MSKTPGFPFQDAGSSTQGGPPSELQMERHGPFANGRKSVAGKKACNSTFSRVIYRYYIFNQ